MIAANKESVGELVAENLARAQVFEKHHIDYCCQGQRTLEEVCHEQGLRVDTLVSELDSAPADDNAGTWASVSLARSPRARPRASVELLRDVPIP